MKDLTIEDVKKIPAFIIPPANQVFKAQAKRDAIASIIIPIQTDVLEQHQFKAERIREEEEEIVTNPKDCYRLDDKHFSTYQSEIRDKYQKAGIELKPDICPLLEAENEVRKARHQLIEAAEPVTGLSLDQITRNLDRYRKYVDLLLSIAAQQTKTNK